MAKNNGFITRLNDKFTVDAREARTACVLPTPADLAEQFTIQNTRTVRNDYTVQLNTIVYQLSRKSVVNARAKVIIKQYLDGTMAIFAGKYMLQYQSIENYVKPLINHDRTSNNNQVVPRCVQRMGQHFKQHYKPEKTYRYSSSSKQLQTVGQFYGG